jgi:hypothetical protein
LTFLPYFVHTILNWSGSGGERFGRRRIWQLGIGILKKIEEDRLGINLQHADIIYGDC